MLNYKFVQEKWGAPNRRYKILVYIGLVGWLLHKKVCSSVARLEEVVEKEFNRMIFCIMLRSKSQKHQPKKRCRDQHQPKEVQEDKNEKDEEIEKKV